MGTRGLHAVVEWTPAAMYVCSVCTLIHFTCAPSPSRVLYVGKRSISRPNFARSCSVGYAQTMPGVFTPGITLQRTSVSSVGHSYPYPELLKVLYDSHTRTRNFWKFCTPVPTIPGVRVYHFYNVCEFCTPVPLYPELL